MSGEKGDRRNSKREIPLGRNVWTFYEGVGVELSLEGQAQC